MNGKCLAWCRQGKTMPDGVDLKPALSRRMPMPWMPPA